MTSFTVLICGFDTTFSLHHQKAENDPTSSVDIEHTDDREENTKDSVLGIDDIFQTVISDSFKSDIALSTNSEIDIHTKTLPSSYLRAWQELHQQILDIHPHLVLLINTNKNAHGIEMERCATQSLSFKNADPCADINIPLHSEDETKPTQAPQLVAYWTRLPLRHILTNFANSQIPATISSPSDNELTNSTLYELLQWCANHTATLGGLINLPLLHKELPPASAIHISSRGIKYSKACQGLKIIIEQSINYFRDMDVKI